MMNKRKEEREQKCVNELRITVQKNRERERERERKRERAVGQLLDRCWTLKVVVGDGDVCIELKILIELSGLSPFFNR